MSRIFIRRQKSDPVLGLAADLLLQDPPNPQGGAVDYCYWYFASLAIFQLHGPSGRPWKSSHSQMKEAFRHLQIRASGTCLHGSCEPVDRWSREGGRVYATAIGALSLEFYTRGGTNVFVPESK